MDKLSTHRQVETTALPNWQEASVFYDPKNPLVDLDREMLMTKIVVGVITVALFLAAAGLGAYAASMA